jgi:tetratricopeptide (TPR) repeat protein
MFLKSPHKFSFTSLTFALVLSANIFFSGQSFAGASEDFTDGLASFNQAAQQKEDAQFRSYKSALTRFALAFDNFPENSTDKAKAKLFLARTADQLKPNASANSLLHSQNCTDPIALYQQAVDLYKIAEENAAFKNGLADALFYQAENTFARGLREDAKVGYQSSLDLNQSNGQKIRTGKKLAPIMD